MRRSFATVAPLAVAFAIVSAAAAQEAVKAPRSDTAFHIEAGADAWFARLVGDVTSAAGVDRDVKDLDLRDSEVAFAGQLRLSMDRCFAEIGGFAFETDGDYASGGDTFATDFQWWGATVDVGYALFTPFADQAWPWGDAAYDRYGDNVNSNGDYTVDLRLSPILGVSYYDIELNDRNVTQATAVSIDGGWMAARLGGEMQLWIRPGADFAFLKAIAIEAAVTAGPMIGLSGDADGSGLAVELEAGVRIMVLDNVGARLGYRIYDGDFDSTGSAGDLDLGAYGLFAGVAIRF